MNKLDIINIPAYEFFAPADLTDAILKHVQTLEYTENKSNSGTNYFYKNEDLFSWFDSCLQKVQTVYFKNDIKFKITDCWVNKSSKLQAHHRHSHANSIISGIFYLTSHSDSETVFYYPNPWTFVHKLELLQICKTEPKHLELMQVITPSAGKLVLFPSQIEHSVKTNKGADRYTIAFNTFVSGNISNTRSTNLQILC